MDQKTLRRILCDQEMFQQMLRVVPRTNFDQLLEHLLVPEHSPEHCPEHVWPIFGAFVYLGPPASPCMDGGVISPATTNKTTLDLDRAPDPGRARCVSVVLWPSWFLETWGTKAEKTHIFKNRVFLLALPPKAAEPHNICVWRLCGVLALVPKASKKPLGQKTTSGSQ